MEVWEPRVLGWAQLQRQVGMSRMEWLWKKCLVCP